MYWQQNIPRRSYNNLTDDTIVIYSTDNGNELMLWPDGGYAPFRGERGTTWEGGVRVPMLARWPGQIPAGSSCNGRQNHEDVYVTLAAAPGLTDIKEKLLDGTKLGDSELTYKVHLDGFNQLDMWTGKDKKSARKAHFYYDETELRFDDVEPRHETGKPGSVIKGVTHAAVNMLDQTPHHVAALHSGRQISLRPEIWTGPRPLTLILVAFYANW